MITEEVIMRKLRAYLNSSQGKKWLKEEHGIEFDENALKRDFRKKGREMKEILFKHISGVIKSFKEEDIIVGEPKIIDGNWQLNISFNKEALRRDSLYLEGYPEGLEDIVLLMSRGYHAKDYVYGYYNTRAQHGYSWVNARSKKDRDPNPFLKNAIDEFNSKENDGAVAELLGEYK